MVENNLKDYSDQQYQVVRLLSEINPEAVTETYRFKHVIVDEFQDSNDFQMLFISELINTSKFESLMVVGDDAQAIYLSVVQARKILLTLRKTGRGAACGGVSPYGELPFRSGDRRPFK